MRVGEESEVPIRDTREGLNLSLHRCFGKIDAEEESIEEGSLSVYVCNTRFSRQVVLV